jgi:predicted ribosome quality control (RQC) complex YloA/Tae2 family protein
MDLFFLHSIVAELIPLLVGRRLLRAFQSGDKDLAIDFNLRDGRWLSLSTDQSNLTLHLTVNNPRTSLNDPRTDTAFVSLLRKYLKSASLIAIDALGYDRVVQCEFEALDDQEQPIRRQLIIQMTGRAADVILLQGSTVLASLRQRDYSSGYSLPSPPEHLFDPYLLNPAQWGGIIAENGGDISRAARRLIGFTDHYALELVKLAERLSPDIALQKLLSRFGAHPATPVIYTDFPLEQAASQIGRGDIQIILSPVDLLHLNHLEATTFASANEAADRWFTLRQKQNEFTAHRQHAISLLNQKLKKLESLRQKLQAESAKFANPGMNQRYGELLLANLHQTEKTGDQFNVTDYFEATTPTISIPAVGKPTAQEAAAYYFKLARKGRSGRRAIEARLPGIEREIEDKKRAFKQLQEIISAERLQEFIRVHDLIKPKPLQPAALSSKRTKSDRQEKISGARCYRTGEGYELLVGRTDRDNDHLTTRVAKSFDLWFHVADYPGSHVILRNPKRQPVPQGSIIEAAQLAAKFSQAREDTRVAVNYCERKFVTKPKGFAPGQVRLSSFKTVIVAPREPDNRIY